MIYIHINLISMKHKNYTFRNNKTNIQNDIVLNNNFVKEFISNSLFYNLDSRNIVLSDSKIYSNKFQINFGIVTLLQVLLYSLNNNNTTKLFETLINLIYVNIFWLLFSFVYMYWVKKINNQLNYLIVLDKYSNRIVEPNNFLSLTVKYGISTLVVWVVEFIKWICTFNCFIYLIYYFIKKNNPIQIELFYLFFLISY